MRRCIKNYERNDYNKIYEVLSTLRNKKVKINNILIENFKDMLHNLDFEQDHWSKTAESIFKNAHDGIRITKWLIYYDRSSYDKMNYFDLMVSIWKNLIINDYLDGKYYVEVKDHRYRFHPTGKIKLRKRNPPTSLRAQYQVQNNTQIRKNQKVIKINKNELKFENYPKIKQPNIQNQKQKSKLPNCPTCKQNE